MGSLQWLLPVLITLLPEAHTLDTLYMLFMEDMLDIVTFLATDTAWSPTLTVLWCPWMSLPYKLPVLITWVRMVPTMEATLATVRITVMITMARITTTITRQRTI